MTRPTILRNRRGLPAARGRAGRGLASLGPLSQRPAMGHGARGLQRRRRCLGLFPARPCPQPGLSLGRGRDRRLGRRAAALVPGHRAVERARPDPEGAAVRPDQRRGQPRRGRQGALLPPRRHADAFVHADALQVSAGGISLRASCCGRTGGAGPSDPEYELADTGVFADNRYFDVVVEYAKAAPDDIADAGHRGQPRAGDGARSTCCRSSGPATPGAGPTARAGPLLGSRTARCRRGIRGCRT